MTVITRFGSVNAQVAGAWTTPTNIYADDGAYAIAPLPTRNTSMILRVTNFGFTIPAGSTINSVVYKMEYKLSTTASTTSITLTSEYNSVARGTNTVIANEPLTDTLVTKTLNGTWTVAELNSNLAGALLTVRRSGYTACSISFDYISITVDYTLPAIPVTITVSQTQAYDIIVKHPTILVAYSAILQTTAPTANAEIITPTIIMQPSQSVVMTLDLTSTLRVQGEIVEGSEVTLNKDEGIIITELVEGTGLNLDSLGVLTVFIFKEGEV